jgi:2'-5' RNA ligase
MAKELMWVCGLLPENTNKRIVEICKEANRNIGLSESVFRFPLHISMKKSFYTISFDEVKMEIMEHIRKNGVLHCRTSEVTCHRNMLWLPVEADGEIKDWHNSLDEILLSKYGILIDRFDVEFEPHITLFTGVEREEKLEGMRKELTDKIPPTEMEISRFVIGSSAHGDEYFNLEV